jgi:GalNAc-alpha-(1->4)-GalNAc-alpha-(1->3)-diNAcBac-PP-undecaprenol alpha-1,4-N-acetyl-D-galactosaminyltransferase
MKLAMIIPALTAGGAERVMSIMVNYWAGHGWDIVLITLDDGSEPPFFALHDRIQQRHLALLRDSTGALDALFNNGRRIVGLRRTLRAERPDAVISFLDTTNVLTLLAARGLRLPVIVSEHIDPGQSRIKQSWNALRHRVYPWADRVVVLTRRVAEFFPPALQAKLAVIPNPVVLAPPGKSKSATLPHGPWIVAMGRLAEQKGFDILLDSFATLTKRHAGWRLAILGEGPLRGALETQRERLGLTQKVLLPGRVEAPETVLAQAQLFVLPSRFEGFPMALCEAMALGLPVVAFDCPTGPREIIRDGVDGVLIPPEDTALLAAAMERLMTDPGERQRLAALAPEVAERFALDKVMAMWEAVVEEALAQGSS